MTRQRLSNERWGFSSNCFVCEPTNALGLRQAFFHDTDADAVVAELELGPEHSGAPSYVHGGVQLALLDEAMAWAAIAIAGRFAVTATFRSEFHHPIKVGSRYRLEARITERSTSSLEATSRIFDDRDRDRTTAAATLVVLTEAQALDAGVPTDEATQRFVRGMTSTGHVMLVAVAGAVGYLMGTFPSADVASRLASGGTVDLLSAGSANPGALNVAQQLGTRWGVAVLVADGAKGAVAGVVGRRLAGGAGAYAGAAAAIGGHIAPVWTGFRGGKGVATSAGACLAVFPAYFPLDAAVAATTAAGTRNPETAVRVSSTVWILSALVWWRRGWPNLWGPAPSIGLPAFAAAGAAMILAKFAHARRAAAGVA